ncbi:MAG TPA: ribosome silencing factor, partial [Clostridia bacterium]|nr:ribosome silencing factor [Clostridia bacterium]
MEEKEQVLALCEALYNKKALDIVAVHVEERTIIASWFILCSGRSVTQVKALCDELEKEAKLLGLDLRRREGYSQGQWVVLDYSSILVHLFIPD